MITLLLIEPRWSNYYYTRVIIKELAHLSSEMHEYKGSLTRLEAEVSILRRTRLGGLIGQFKSWFGCVDRAD